MRMDNDILQEMLAQNQTSCGFAFSKLTSENAAFRLNPQSASAGFIYRHVGETMNLFGFFFGTPTEVQNTTMGQTDTGKTYDLAESHRLVRKGYAMLQALVENTPNEAWLDPIDTPFFGTVSRVRLFSHVLFHNAHHAGQISLTLARGAKMGMIQLKRTDSDNADFIALVKCLDADLAERDGEEHSFYAQFNKIDKIKYAVVAYDHDRPVACGAMKAYAPSIMEIKRMYTVPDARGKGVASQVLAELESWAAELSIEKCILETGKRQPEAIELYRKNGYQRIPNFGQYAGVENSVCFEKEMKR